MSVILSAIWVAALKFKPLRINEPPLGALILLSQAFLKALNKDVANYHTLAYSSILISSATDLPLLTITSTLHARSISLAFVLFKVGLPSPNWNCLKQLGVYSRHVL